MEYTLDYKEFAALERRAAAEGCVLLKNDNNALPIKKGERAAVFGRAQFNYYKSGLGSGGLVNTPYVTDIVSGLKNTGYCHINEKLEDQYRAWLADHPYDFGSGWANEPWSQKEMPVTPEFVKDIAEESDIAIIILGRTAGEGKDISAVKGSYYLSDEEERLLECVCGAFKRTAVLLNVGGIIDMNWVEKYNPQAVLYVWQGGMEGGNGVADLLTGRTNPSGKLTDTIAENLTDYPSAVNFGNDEQNIYREDIYVGYRYFETFAPEKVIFPFGFGLSYSEFEIKFQPVKWKDTCGELAVSVKNKGEYAGREVIQVYAEAPQGKLGKPVRQLVAFRKTELMESGQETGLTISFNLDEIASYDDSGVTGYKSCYLLERGTYFIFAGTDVKSAECIGSYEAAETRIIQKVQEALSPTLNFTRMRPASNDAGKSEGRYSIEWEAVPTRTCDLTERISREVCEESPFTGDLGYRFGDVINKKVSLDKFLCQLKNEDLCALVQGEGMCSPKVQPGTAGAFGGITAGLSEFGIPAACCADGPSGIRMDCGLEAFLMPCGTALACTFDTDLVEKLYELEGAELRKNKIDTLLGPGMNIHRSPLNGRNFEYFSEDPYVTGKMAAAQLKGMQKYHVTGTIKHFACNNQEYKRYQVDSAVSERALREIYLKGFHMAVEEGAAASIMSTYGPVNGIYTSGNYDLLTVILRKEWNYQGIVMTDWWSMCNEQGEEPERENLIPMIRAQNDLYMVVTDAEKSRGTERLLAGLREGRISRGLLLRSAGNICRFLMNSAAADRALKIEDVYHELNYPESNRQRVTELQTVTAGESTSLDVTGLNAGKGKAFSYTLNFEQAGKYWLVFTIRSAADLLAQTSLSVFLNNRLIRTITLNGSDDCEWKEERTELPLFTKKQGYLMLYFAENGMEIKEIRIEKQKTENENK